MCVSKLWQKNNKTKQPHSEKWSQAGREAGRPTARGKGP